MAVPAFRVYAPGSHTSATTSPEDDQWQELALCAQTDPEAFFPEHGGSVREAKQICLSCEVRILCLKFALTNNENYGVWGGLSERERYALSRARN